MRNDPLTFLEPVEMSVGVVVFVRKLFSQLAIQHVPGGHVLSHRPFLSHGTIVIQVATVSHWHTDLIRLAYSISAEPVRNFPLKDDPRTPAAHQTPRTFEH